MMLEMTRVHVKNIPLVTLVVCDKYWKFLPRCI